MRSTYNYILLIIEQVKCVNEIDKENNTSLDRPQRFISQADECRHGYAFVDYQACSVYTFEQ